MTIQQQVQWGKLNFEPSFSDSFRQQVIGLFPIVGLLLIS